MNTTIGPRARSTYRHGDLRRALLDAGIELARGGGPDAVVLREDILSVPQEKIGENGVQATILGGKVVYGEV